MRGGHFDADYPDDRSQYGGRSKRSSGKVDIAYFGDYHQASPRHHIPGAPLPRGGVDRRRPPLSRSTRAVWDPLGRRLDRSYRTLGYVVRCLFTPRRKLGTLARRRMDRAPRRPKRL